MFALSKMLRVPNRFLEYFNTLLRVILNLNLRVEFLHAVGRNKDLEPGVSASESLGNLQKAASRILLKD